MAGKERETEANVGFGRSDAKTFVIPNANTGANIEAVNLGRNYAYIIIRCDNCATIASATTLGVEVAEDEAQALDSVYELASNTLTKLAPTLPTSGSLRFMCVPAFGAQYVHLTLSKNTTGATTFTIYGFAESVQG